MALTRSQLMRIKENRKYWREREANQREAYIRTEDAELAEINRIYADMYRWAEREVNAFYGKYASAEGIDITEAKRRVSQLDIEEYEKLAKEYVKDRDFSDRANQEMRLYNATMKINRLELLKAQIGLKLVDGINDIDKHWEKIATERATQEIIRQSGILGKTLTDTETARTAKQIVNADFYNATFSERIWSHMDNLKSDLSIELQKGFIAGVSSREMARRLKEHAFNKSERDAFRLARTELRRIQTDVAKDNYERNGITQYEYLAVNPSACPICKELDGRIFDVARMKAGLNAPPIHPNCHCTTAPHIDNDEYEQWLTWLENGGTTAQWDEMSPAKRQSWYDKILKSIPKKEEDTFDIATVPFSTAGERIRKLCERSGVEYRQVEKWESTPPEKTIIQRLAGGDKTKGSCFSLACAYVGNKQGLNVLDFRGGTSQDTMSRSYRAMARLDGVVAMFEQGGGIRPAKALLKQVDEGKEYMFTTGRHTAIVRKQDGKLQYLEMQSATDSGWHDFEGDRIYYKGTPYERTVHMTMSDTLKYRFACRGNTISESNLTEIGSFNGSEEFRALLGYINTAEGAQKKGVEGSVK